MRSGLNRCFAGQGGGQKRWEFVIGANNELAGFLACERQTVAQFVEKCRQWSLLRCDVVSCAQACEPRSVARMRFLWAARADAATGNAGPFTLFLTLRAARDDRVCIGFLAPHTRVKEQNRQENDT